MSDEMLAARKRLTQMPQSQRAFYLQGNKKSFSSGLTPQETLTAAGVTREWLASWLGFELDSDSWVTLGIPQPHGHDGP